VKTGSIVGVFMPAAAASATAAIPTSTARESGERSFAHRNGAGALAGAARGIAAEHVQRHGRDALMTDGALAVLRF
jgi:hypothetical protein